MYHPMGLGRTIDNIDRFMEGFFGDDLTPGERLASAFSRVPPVDIKEKDNEYVMEMELPGYDEKKINLSVDGGMITVESAKIDEKEKKDEDKYLMRERTESSFSRSFHLPENADPENIKASFKNGLLTLEIKKRQEAQKKTIQIMAE
jgi:HSP20 family protein